MSVIIFGPNAKVIGYPILIVSRYCVVSSSIENAFSKAKATVAVEKELTKAEQDLAKRKREILVENKKLELEGSEARAKIAEKDKYTAQQRLAFLNTYTANYKKQLENNLEIAKEELRIAEGRAA